jgi:hypothetical protein
MILMDLSWYWRTYHDTENYRSVWCQPHYDVIKKTIMVSFECLTFIFTIIPGFKKFSCCDWLAICLYNLGLEVDYHYLVELHTLLSCCFKWKQSYIESLRYLLGLSRLYGSWIYYYLCNQTVPITTKVVNSNLAHGVLDATLCDKVCQWLVTGRWFSLVSSTNKTDCHNITETLLKVALNNIPLTLTCLDICYHCY